jgi:putative oxidoreductase
VWGTSLAQTRSAATNFTLASSSMFSTRLWFPLMQDGARFPVPASFVAIFMELPVAFAVAVGAFTRSCAALLALYTLGTALIAHHYWTMTGVKKVDSLESFYKNLSIIGGFLLLCITGAGKYSIDALLGL